MKSTGLDICGMTAAPEAVAGAEDAGTFDPLDVLMAGLRASVFSRQAAKAGISLSAEMARVLAGRSATTPAKGDWRFVDETWASHPGYRRAMQLYLAWAGTLASLVDEADLDWRGRQRARIGVEILTSAMAPTNCLPGNPAAIKRAIETRGASLLRGARHFASDLLHNRGMPSQVDASRFTVGQNLATTPGAVVYRDEMLELIQYSPTTPKVGLRPVVLIPPEINKYYFLDLAPGRSFIEHAVSRGVTFFTISWRNPRREHGDWGLDEYGAAILRAIDVAREISGSDDVNALGMCAGGITMSVVLSHLAATGDSRVHSASFGVTLLDLDCPALVGALRSRPLLSFAKRRSARAGVLDGRSLASVFTWMRPNELVWNYWVNNYLMGNTPPAFDLLAWNDDKTNLPGRLHGQFIDIFEHNSLCRANTLTVLATPVDLSRVTIDTYVTGGLTDHLTPWEGCYRTTQILSGASTFVLSPTGHVQTQVSPPSNPKAHYFVGPEPGPDPHEWRRQAERRDGSWWDHWADWVLARSGGERTAPRRLGSRRHPVLEPAPGRYVLERA
jgi:polyhydroxyalkanoate synthase